MRKIFAPNVTLAAIKVGLKDTFAETLGLEMNEIGDDFLRGKITVDKRHLRPGSIMNGGVSLGLIETVGSIAARCVIHDQPKNSLGIQVSANHLQVARPGDVLTTTATAVHIGRSTHIWDVAIENQKGRLICSGRITMLIVDH